MAISGQQTINIGLPNEATNSDSLYTAFQKTQNNFTTLFNSASSYNTYVGGEGITATANSTTNTVTIVNTGVTYLNAGTGVTLSGNTGNITISAAAGGGGSGTVTSVGVVGASGNARIIPSGTNPVVGSGTIVLDLTTTGVTPGTYTYPTLTVDDYGRINNISNGNSVGTVTSIGVIGGPGMLVTGSPITTAGEITIVNDGVVRLNAGTGIALTDNTGNITISTAQGVGTVTSIEIISSTLTVSGSPIVSSGAVIIDLPSTVFVDMTFDAQVFIATSNLKMEGGTNGYFLQTDGAGNLSWTAGTTSPPTYGAGGSNTQIQFNDAGAPNGSSGLTFNKTSNLTSMPGNVVAVGNVTGGNLTTGGLVVATGNVTGGNLTTGGLVVATGNVTGGNLTTGGLVVATGNVTGGNLVTAGVVTSTGNVTGGNLVTAGVVTATGNITATANVIGGNLTTSGLVVATGNITGGNLVTGGVVASTGNVNGGNLTTGGLVVATGNVTGGNLTTGGLVVATGNVTGGNITTGGQVVATDNVTGNSIISNKSLFVKGSENLLNTAPVDLSVIASYFTTTGLSSATLGDGTSGQIKTFMMVGDSGDMVITVASPGWGGSGTMTFNDVGDGCTLQFVNSKWYCIGNNGVTFG